VIQPSQEVFETKVPVAEYYPLFNEYAANSQYGYPLEWFKTEQEAIMYARKYYQLHPELDARIFPSVGHRILEHMFESLYNNEPVSEAQTRALFTVSECQVILDREEKNRQIVAHCR
jgi:hypothetical protein